MSGVNNGSEVAGQSNWKNEVTFIDMRKTMKEQVLEKDQEQNFGHVNYDLHAKRLIEEIKKCVHLRSG